MKKMATILLALMLSISLTCIPTLAAESKFLEETKTNTALQDNIATANILPYTSGSINNSVANYSVSVPSSGYYTFTLAVTNISGNDNVWVIFQRNGSNAIIDTNVNSSYQKRVYLPAGTYYLQLYSQAYWFYTVTIQ